MSADPIDAVEAVLLARVDGVLAAGLVRDGRLDDLVLLPTEGAAVPGTVLVGRVSRIAAGMDGAFLDIGSPQHALLRARDLDRSIGDPALPLARRLHEGQKLAVKLVHPGYDDKGPRVIARVGAALQDAATERPAGHVLREADPMAELVHLLQPLDPEEIVVADTLARLQVMQCWAATGSHEPAVTVDPGGRPFARFDADSAIDQALGREVALDGGGRLTFDPTRALTVVDVDSGAAVRDTDDLNRRAAAEIARQLRIRNIAGVIVIDFIDGRAPARQAPLAATMRTQTTRDRAGCRLAGFGPLGLFELSRKRTGAPLAQLWPAADRQQPARLPA